LTPEQVLAALPAEMREALRQQLLREPSTPPASEPKEGA
jgi:hypothetical protein